MNILFYKETVEAKIQLIKLALTAAYDSCLVNDRSSCNTMVFLMFRFLRFQLLLPCIAPGSYYY